MIAPGAPKRILIIKPSALGDVVGAVPVLRALRRAFPESHIAWLVARAWAPAIEGDRDLSEVVIFDRKRLGSAIYSSGAAGDLWRFLRTLRRGRYDWVIDLQGLLRTGLFAAFSRAPVRAGFADAREWAAKVFYTHSVPVAAVHAIDRNIELVRALGVQAGPEDYRLGVAPQGKEFAERFCREHSLRGRDYLACFPATTWPTKHWPIRHWRSAIGQLVKDMPIVLMGGPGDRELCSQVASGLGQGVHDLSGLTNVPAMIGMIASAACVVCGDTGANFMAPAVGTPVVTILGPNRADRIGPYRGGKAVISTAACQGCHRKSCSHISCMEMIDPATVVAAAREMLAATRIG